MNNDAIHKTALERLPLCIDGDQHNRLEAMDDLEKASGKHWPDELKREREATGRPCLTINSLPQFARQVTGDIRRMNPAIQIIPGDDIATPELAELFEGIVRNIQYRSDASSVYERAAESAAQCGMGFFRILTDYEDAMSFDQEILVKYIHNPFSVYVDPEAREPNRSDAKFAFITSTMSDDDYKKAYPDAASVSVDADGTTDTLETWRQGGDVVIAEYFWKETKPATICKYADGTVEISTGKKKRGVIDERPTEIPTVYWVKMSGAEILEGPKEFPSKHIPIIAVMGEELYLGDKVYRSSVIRHAKEPAIMYNYWRSAQTELIALQPKAPFLVTPTQINGFETFWNDGNTANRPYLPYNPDPQAPVPQRMTPPVPSSGMMAEVSLAAEDMKRTTGIYDAALGNASNEKSGVAIRQRQMESDVSTSIYSDNMSKAIAQCGRIIVDMIPRVYDTQRMVRTIAKDDTPKLQRVNVPVMTADGMGVANDVSKGRLDVKVAVGPNYSTRRQETAESMMSALQAMPQIGMVAGDILVKSMDWPDADQVAERLKSQMPPVPGEEQQQDPAAMQAMQAQQQQQQAMMAREQKMAEIMQELTLRTETAKAQAAEAQAKKAGFEAEEARAKAHMAFNPPAQAEQPR